MDIFATRLYEISSIALALNLEMSKQSLKPFVLHIKSTIRHYHEIKLAMLGSYRVQLTNTI